MRQSDASMRPGKAGQPTQLCVCLRKAHVCNLKLTAQRQPGPDARKV